MSKVARIKTALLTALLWTLEVLGALALAGFLALLVYVLLLRLGLALERAASIAVSLWPAFVVAIFTVALWRSTQAQAEATQAMRELQQTLARSELVPCLAFSVKSNQLVLHKGEVPGQPLVEVCNLGRLGVLVGGVNAKSGEELGQIRVKRVERDPALSKAPWKPVGEPPFPIMPGECVALWFESFPQERFTFSLELAFSSVAAPERIQQASIDLKANKNGLSFTLEPASKARGACELKDS